MDEELEPLPEPDEIEEAPPRKGAGFLLLAAVLLAGAIAVYTGIAQTFAGLLVFPGIPLLLLWFVWHVFLRRVWRMRRIRQAQEKRELREAALRKKL